jgi:drug/metabolite transporter (DMT)-like permease
MRPLIMIMLVVQLAIFVVTAWTVMFERTNARNPRRPIWSSLAISLIIIAGTSWNIAEDHPGQPGADLLAYGSPLLLGMALMAAFIQIRQRRGLDVPAT